MQDSHAVYQDGQLSIDSEHQRPETDPDHPEESAAALQCAVVTQSCAGEHNVYWFRHESGESPPGIIYTQERRNAQCERRSDGNSTTHKCVYNLPKNISRYDAGIYYCAVATCGEILIGEGRKVDSPGPDTPWSTIALVLAASNCLSVIVIIILGSQLYKHRRKGSADNADVVVQNHLKIVQAGDSVNFTCILLRESRNSIVWVKQRVGEKPLPIVSSYQGLPAVFENGFDKHKRFFVTKDESSFNLSITNTEESDTATYFCVIYGQLSIDSEHQRPETDPDDPEESAAALQCAVVTQSCAGEHNVYWFRHESGESPPGIIYTQERRNAQCERRSDGNSTTQKCVYNLPKNISHYDAGIYYCAVATCGEILFGEGRKVDSPGPGIH
ncbi:unnamed protein product [Leuciscus chuanchicus]